MIIDTGNMQFDDKCTGTSLFFTCTKKRIEIIDSNIKEYAGLSTHQLKTKKK